MRDNVIIPLDPTVDDYNKSQGANSVAIVDSLSTNVMKITSNVYVYVQSAQRLGKVTHTTPSLTIITRIPDSDQRSLVLYYLSQLKDDHHYISH
jgi:hypothetical protein